MKNTNNSNNPLSYTNSHTSLHPDIQVTPVRVVNSWDEDFIYGKFPGRTTGIAAGYTSAISTSFSLVLPGNPTTYPFISSSGANDVQMRSTSAQDSAGGTGSYLQAVFVCDTNFDFKIELVALNGTTPVSLTTPNIYHVYFSFPALPGSSYNGNNLTSSNAGVLYIGRGATVGGAGFATNLAWNRIGDGFTSSSIYVVPRQKLASLWSVKYNGDSAGPSIFITISRSSRSAQWTLNSEDLVAETTVIQRSLVGGALPPGGEFTVLAKRTGSGGSVATNFVMTLHEFDSKIYQDVSSNPV